MVLKLHSLVVVGEDFDVVLWRTVQSLGSVVSAFGAATLCVVVVLSLCLPSNGYEDHRSS